MAQSIDKRVDNRSYGQEIPEYNEKHLVGRAIIWVSGEKRAYRRKVSFLKLSLSFSSKSRIKERFRKLLQSKDKLISTLATKIYYSKINKSNLSVLFYVLVSRNLGKRSSISS